MIQYCLLIYYGLLHVSPYSLLYHPNQMELLGDFQAFFTQIFPGLHVAQYNNAHVEITLMIRV